MNWNNIDLTSHEIDSALIDKFTFEDLLLMISCNIQDINRATVKKEFFDYLKTKIEETRDIFEANLDNIVTQALKERDRK